MPTKGTEKKKSNGGATLGFEATLWSAADKLRGHMDAAEYKHVVLGLIFLKYISDSFPCCGSGGMFVQSVRFVKEHATGNGNLPRQAGLTKAKGDISTFGQESNPTTWKLANSQRP